MASQKEKQQKVLRAFINKYLATNEMVMNHGDCDLLFETNSTDYPYVRVHLSVVSKEREEDVIEEICAKNMLLMDRVIRRKYRRPLDKQ